MDIYSKEIVELTASIESYQYAKKHMGSARRFESRQALMDFSIENTSVPGMALEFGVASGSSINQIATRLSGHTVHGFDSFEGLPESWEWYQAGAFAQERLPEVLPNVNLVKGWFERTLPSFLDENIEKVSLLHVDCDLYSSTQVIFSHLRNRIVSGTIIVFDEYFNYPSWKEHEFLAFQEFVNKYSVLYEYIGMVPSQHQVAVRVLK